MANTFNYLQIEEKESNNVKLGSFYINFKNLH